MSAHNLPLAAVLLLIASRPLFSADASKQLAVRTQSILKAHCYRCHGQDGAIEGGMNYGTDLAKLVARKKIIPGNPSGSRLFKRIEEGTMPPPAEKSRPNREEIAAIKQWIDAGAPAGEVSLSRPTI